MTPCRALLPLLAILMFPGTGGLRAQTRLGVAFYDTDHLYDTVPALFYNDEKYTPDGELHWTAARYDRKIAAIASVIDSLGMPLVGLAGVENEQVVRDLAARCTAPYCYLHRTLNTLDGLDLALLYYGDLFVPDRIETGWGYLLVEGELAGRPVAIVLSRQSRFVPGLLEELRERRPGRPAAGDGPHGDGRSRAFRSAGCAATGRAGREGQCAFALGLADAGQNTDRHGFAGRGRRRLCPPPALRRAHRQPAPDLPPDALCGRGGLCPAGIRLSGVKMFGGRGKFLYLRNPFPVRHKYYTTY